MTDPFVLPLDLAQVQPGGAITPTMAAQVNAHTLQALIETSYVRTGNQILSDGLSELEEALDATQTSLDTLATLQQLHNSVKVESLSAFGFDFASGLYNEPFLAPERSDRSPSLFFYQQAYYNWASGYFGTPIFPEFIFETAQVAANGSGRGSYDSFADFAEQLVTVKQTLSANIAALTNISPSSLSDPNSLLSKLIVVYNDLPPVEAGGVISYNNAKIWALDSYAAYEGVDLAQSSYVDPTYDSSGVPHAPRVDSWGRPLNPLVERTVGGVTVFQTFGGGLGGTPTVIAFIVGGTVTLVPANPIESSYLGTPTERGDAARAGDIQQNIQFAVTAAQSLNDSQKERVRRFLFVFEEFYKSASTLLSRITQIIEKIAQGIRPA